DYSDLQVTTFFQSLTLVSNAATAEVKGVDLELLAQPNDSFNFGVSLSWLDATYDKFDVPYGVCSAAVLPLNDPGCADVPGTRPVGSPRVVDASGNRLNNAPEFKGNVFGEYNVPVGNAGKLTFFGQLSYTDDIYFNAANSPEALQDAVTLLDARIGWTNPDETLEVSLYGKNLSDEEYFHNIVQFTSSSLPPPGVAVPGQGTVITDPFSVGHSLGYPAPGRTWGLSVNYRF
ncbi:MAG TPA: TonB-dependent receptor, partial [Steroidobacteraceae bacterium]|nr:TonB-dependent receptor [Steroidobacteraceae bacterium]